MDDLEKQLSPKYMQLGLDIQEQAVLLYRLCLKLALGKCDVNKATELC